MGHRNPYVADANTRRAKAKGYPARSVFKLEEIDRRVGLLRAGQNVLDLGAAPGSWSLYAAQRIGSGGHLLAIDLQRIAQTFPSNVEVVIGDALTLETAALERFAPYDVVLSDMAPNTSGNKLRDHALSFELFTRALDVAIHLGKPGGAFVGKLFMSEDFPKAKAALSDAFARSRVVRPEGTRANSTEVFLVGQDRRN